MDLQGSTSEMDVKCHWNFILLVVIAIFYMFVVYWKNLKFSYDSVYKIKQEDTMSYNSGISKNTSSTNHVLQYLPSALQTSDTSQIASSELQVSPTHLTDNKNNNKSHYLCMHSAGGLGNQMFQFAAAYAIAKIKHMTLVAKKHILVRQIFKIHGQFEENNRINCRLARRLVERKACSFDPRLFNISGKMDYFIGIYTQSWKYFQHFEKELREQFVFRNHTSNIALHIIQNILKKYSKHRSEVTLIGIHVRRGDMLTNPYGYQVATKEYFKKAINYYRRKFKDAIFVVCSNGMVWSKLNIHITNKMEFIENQNREVDLAVLGSCDHVIQSVGSFSWWAAWLAGGTSVFFKWPARERSGLRSAYSEDYSDYFYPGWIGMQ